MSTTKNGKLCVKVREINGNKRLHVLWPVKYNAKAGANLFLLTCKLFQGCKISSNKKTYYARYFKWQYLFRSPS